MARGIIMGLIKAAFYTSLGIAIGYFAYASGCANEETNKMLGAAAKKGVEWGGDVLEYAIDKAHEHLHKDEKKVSDLETQCQQLTGQLSNTTINN